MIELLNSSYDNTQSLFVTYPRTIQITFGNYPAKHEIHNLILDIKNKIPDEDSYKGNVKAKMTGWQEYVNHSFVRKFLNFCITKHAKSNPELFEGFDFKYKLVEAWGNELRKGDSVDLHIHSMHHCIIYLTHGSPLYLPDLQLKITPKPGDYYFFPPYVQHGVDISQDEKNRYCLVLNIEKLPPQTIAQEFKK